MYEDVFDAEQEAIIEKYLTDNSYKDVEDWAQDSDYLYTGSYNGWVDLDDNPIGDPKVALWWAIEAANEGRPTYKVSLSMQFDDVDSPEDAVRAMIEWVSAEAQCAGYRVEWDESTSFIDAERDL